MLTFKFTYGTHSGSVIARNRQHAITQIRDTYGYGQGDICLTS